MSKLADIQNDFLTAFNTRDAAPFAKHLSPHATLSAEKRFAIYQDSIMGGLIHGLRETYEVCEKLVGEDFFEGMAYQFAMHTPSYSSDIGDYGKVFADFVANFPPAQGLPYLADVCRLCWAHHMASRSDFDETFNPLDFDHLPEGATLLQSDYPIQAIWDFCHTDGDAEGVDLDQGGVKLLVWRRGHQIVHTIQ